MADPMSRRLIVDDANNGAASSQRVECRHDRPCLMSCL
jgi:hypothetical protein